MHVVSQRAWGLRLRGITRRLALSPACVLPSPSVHRVSIPDLSSRSSIPCPLMPHAYASMAASRPPPQDWRPGGSLLLSCRTLSFPTNMPVYPGAYGQPEQRDFCIEDFSKKGDLIFRFLSRAGQRLLLLRVTTSPLAAKSCRHLTAKAFVQFTDCHSS